MSLACREYVTRQGCDTVKAAAAVREAIIKVVHPWVADKRIRGYEVMSVRDEEDIVENDLDGDAIHEATNGEFPFVWINITFDSGKLDTSILRPLERDYGLHLLVEFHS